MQSPCQSLNRYSYCLNNPLKYVDPTGHDATIFNDKGQSVTLTDEEVSKLDPRRPYADQIDWSKCGSADLPSTSTGGVSTVEPAPALPSNAEIVGLTTTAGSTTIEEIVGAVGLKCLGLAGLIVSLVTIEGDCENQNIFWNKTIDDFEKNPGNWDKIGEKSESATNSKWKNGTSTEEKYRNKNTGQEIEKHKVVDSNGKVVHEHYRIPDN